MSLTVLSVAYPMAPVSLDAAGGAEQVLAYLDRELVRRGHRSIVVACEGSRPSGHLLPVPLPESELTAEAQIEAHMHTRAALEAALRQERVDLIHMHGVDFHAYLPPPGEPLLATLHLPPEWYPPEVFHLPRPDTFLQCVSESQHRRCPESEHLLPPIPNGIPLELYPFAPEKQDYALALGRICPEKGFDVALDAAETSGIRLIIAGPVYPYPEHLRYFQEAIQPRLDGTLRRWVGGADLARKRELLAGARCLLIPSRAPETSSLVAMEALASGTPVIAFPSGALADLIVDGETGFIVEDAAQMAEAISRVADLDPDRCREYAEHHFDVGKTVQKYLQTYEQLASKPAGPAPRSVEVLTDVREVRQLLPEWTDLYRQCPDASVFLDPVWQMAWWERFGSCPLHALTVRRAGSLVAFALFYIWEGRLVFAGNGLADTLGILAVDSEAAAKLVTALRNYSLDLQEVPDQSPLLSMPHEPWSVCPVLDLRQPLPTRLRKHLRQQRRYLEERGRVEIARGGPESLETLFQLHAARWSERHEAGVLSVPRIQQMHRAVVSGMDSAQLWELRVDDTAVAVFYGFTRNGVTSYYLGGFDPAWERHSPGSLLIEHAIISARAAGGHTFDFLRGAEEYKYRWGATDRLQFAIRTQ